MLYYTEYKQSITVKTEKVHRWQTANCEFELKAYSKFLYEPLLGKKHVDSMAAT